MPEGGNHEQGSRPLSRLLVLARRQPLHGTDFLFSEHVLLTAKLVSLGAVQHGLTVKEFLDVELAG
ncbi:hypothetical protein ACFRQM_41535 [Streptomyces sp. NPDC056831]|uniref:hypothetical protein n=1 Tax=Streptomyces sp. NPDC056831 TaxID=3345954 RepID=UPI00368EBE18